MLKLLSNASTLLWAVIFLSMNGNHAVVTNDKFKDEFLDRINTVRQKGCNCGSTYMPPVPPIT